MPDGFLLTHWLGGFVVYKIGSFSFEMVSHGNCVLSWVKIGIRALLSVFFFFLTFFFIIFSVVASRHVSCLITSLLRLVAEELAGNPILRRILFTFQFRNKRVR